MTLYRHETDGGAEYYSTTYVECENGHREGTLEGVVFRTDGNEIEVFTRTLKKQGIKVVIN